MNQNDGNFSGRAIIISAPSGSGKTTIARNILKKIPGLAFSISACTRKPRSGEEIDGVDYYFISAEEFKTKIREGKFVEWEEVYDGMLYGTLKSEIDRLWAEGKHILFDVDVKGGVQLKNFFSENALALFVKAPSLEEIEKRLSLRQTESEASLRIRMEKVMEELSYEKEFDTTIVNESLEEAVLEAESLVNNFLGS